MGSEPGGWNSSSCSQLSCWGGLGLPPPTPPASRVPLPCSPLTGLSLPWLALCGLLPALRPQTSISFHACALDMSFPGGRRFSSPLYISPCFSQTAALQIVVGLSPAPHLLSTRSPFSLGSVTHFTNIFSTLPQRHQLKCWPGPDLRQASAGLGVSHH